MKTTVKEQTEKRERKTKYSYPIVKENLVRGHSFMTSAKNVKNLDSPPRPSSPPYPQPSNILVLAQLTLGCINIYYSHKHKSDRKTDRLLPTRLL